TERDIARAWNRNRTPIGGEGFEAVDIDESKAPSNLRNQMAQPKQKPAGGYQKAWNYVWSEAPDQEEEPNQEKAALIVATNLQRCPISDIQRAELMQEWASAYGEDVG